MKTDKFQNKYRIPSARAVWHNYNSGDYYITICTSERLHYFGEINNGEMLLNGLGQKFDELILNIKNHNPYCEIPVYQIMPNHVHLIVCVDGRGAVCRDAACRDAACHVSTENAEIDVKRDAACHVSTENTETNAKRDAVCHVSTENTETNAKRDAAYRDAACHVSTNGNGTNDNRLVKNEKMHDIAEQCGLLSTAMGGLKSALTKYANLNKIKFGWQTRFHDHIIRSQEEMNMIATYIENNVTTWENDKFRTK